MKQLVQDTIRGVKGIARDAAQKLFWRFLLGTSLCLIWCAGLGFLTASAFLALGALMEPAWSAFFVGLLLLLVAAGSVAFIRKASARQHRATAPKGPPTANVETSGALATVAFTAAFVLARYLDGEKTDLPG